MDPLLDILLNYGPLGVAVVVLGQVIRSQNREIKELQTEIKTVLTKWRDDKSETVAQVTTAMNNTAASVNGFTDKIEYLKGKR